MGARLGASAARVRHPERGSRSLVLDRRNVTGNRRRGRACRAVSGGLMPQLADTHRDPVVSRRSSTCGWRAADVRHRLLRRLGPQATRAPGPRDRLGHDAARTLRAAPAPPSGPAPSRLAVRRSSGRARAGMLLVGRLRWTARRSSRRRGNSRGGCRTRVCTRSPRRRPRHYVEQPAGCSPRSAISRREGRAGQNQNFRLRRPFNDRRRA